MSPFFAFLNFPPIFYLFRLLSVQCGKFKKAKKFWNSYYFLSAFYSRYEQTQIFSLLCGILIIYRLKKQILQVESILRPAEFAFSTCNIFIAFSIYMLVYFCCLCTLERCNQQWILILFDYLCTRAREG